MSRARYDRKVRGRGAQSRQPTGSRNAVEFGLAGALALLAFLLSPGPAIIGPVAALVVIGGLVQIHLRQRGHHR